MMPADVPRLIEVHSDWRMAGLALALSIITGVLFGLTPAIHASAIDPNTDLKESGRTGGGQSVRQNRSRAALVVLKVALSVVLLVGAGLLIRSFSTMLQQHPGLDPNGLSVGQIWVPVPNNPKMNRYLNPPQQAALARELLHRLAALPGVQKAAIGLSADVPFLSNVRNTRTFSFPDESTIQQNDHSVEFGAVSPDYFAVLKTPLKQGRFFTNHDGETSKKVVVANEAFVRKFSPHREVIGRRLTSVYANAEIESEIIGVAGDVRNDGLDAPPEPRVYASIFQTPGIELAVFLRTQSGLTTVRERLTQTVHAVDPELPVFGVRTMEDLMSASMARRRFSLFLMSAFAALALLLAAMGIYGVMAYVVGQRVQEFGIRSALGARPRDILMLAFRPGLVLTATGTVLGLAASIVVTRLMSSLLFGVSASDPLIFATVPLLLGIVALAACFIPARRATRVSPVQALRS
jgi:predicted permease